MAIWLYELHKSISPYERYNLEQTSIKPNNDGIVGLKRNKKKKAHEETVSIIFIGNDDSRKSTISGSFFLKDIYE